MDFGASSVMSQGRGGGGYGSQYGAQYAQHQQQQQQQQQQQISNGNNVAPPNSQQMMVPQETFIPPTTEQDIFDRWQRMTRTIKDYERLEQIGEGTYGQVYRARCLHSGQTVALKKIRVHHGGYWGMPPTVIREIKILKRLQHPRLVRMIEVVSSKGVEHLDEEDERTVSVNMESKSKNGGGTLINSSSNKKSKNMNDRVTDAREGYKGNLFLVLEYVSHDLTGLMDIAYRFTPVQTKSIFKQLLEALAYMHEKKYIHRDIKSSNILIDSHFRVKLADFGLARCIEPPILDSLNDRGSTQEFTNKVITLWYRPPEILLGSTRYGTPVDVWSAGCILVELLIGKPLFTGKTEMDQLKLIFDLLGTPNQTSWEGFTDLKLIRTGDVVIEKQKKSKLRDKYGQKIVGPAMNLIEKLLELDPKKRLTAERALESRYFKSEPMAPDRPEEMGKIQLGDGLGHFHEFQTKKSRREAKVIASKAQHAARERGLSEKDAEAEYDTVYRQQMKKVAEEGLASIIPPKSKPTRESSDGRRRDRERDRGDRDRDRREKTDRESRREERKEEGGSRRVSPKDKSSKDSRRRREKSRDGKDENRERRRRSRSRDRDRDHRSKSKDIERSSKRRRHDEEEERRVEVKSDGKDGETKVEQEIENGVDVMASQSNDRKATVKPKQEPIEEKEKEKRSGGPGAEKEPVSEEGDKKHVRSSRRDGRRDRDGDHRDRSQRDRDRDRSRVRDHDRDRDRHERREDRHRRDKDKRSPDGRGSKGRDRISGDRDRANDRNYNDRPRDHDRYRQPPRERDGDMQGHQWDDRGGRSRPRGDEWRGRDDNRGPPRPGDQRRGDWNEYGPTPPRGDYGRDRQPQRREDWGERPRGPPPPHNHPDFRGDWGRGPPPDRRGNWGDRGGPPDRRGDSDRGGPPDRRGDGDRGGPPDRRGDGDRGGPPDRRGDGDRGPHPDHRHERDKRSGRGR